MRPLREITYGTRRRSFHLLYSPALNRESAMILPRRIIGRSGISQSRVAGLIRPPRFSPHSGGLIPYFDASTTDSVTVQEIPRSKHAITLDGHQDHFIDDEMICPISLEIMEDPVYFTGLDSNNKKCFERTQILHLLSKANPHHPLTREPITLQQMQRDDELRQRIEDFVDLAGSRKQAGVLSALF